VARQHLEKLRRLLDGGNGGLVRLESSLHSLEHLRAWRPGRVRTIRKRPVPREADACGTPGWPMPALRRTAPTPSVVQAVEDAWWLSKRTCAYTGHSIWSPGHVRRVDFHIEHLMAQAALHPWRRHHYNNLLAAGTPELQLHPHTARGEGDWPSPRRGPLFVSRCRGDCSVRFSFTHAVRCERQGRDTAAKRPSSASSQPRTLKQLRREAISRRPQSSLSHNRADRSAQATRSNQARL